mgnify:CR=1 FL=1
MQQFDDMDAVIKARTPEALQDLTRANQRFGNLSLMAVHKGVTPLDQFAGYEPEAEINDLLGRNGAGAQEAAIGNIKVSDFDRELNRRQSEGQERRAFATGDVSGASLLESLQLGSNQQSNQITGRLNELMPLAAIGAQTRSRQSQLFEAGAMDIANQNFATGTQKANIRMGGVAPLIQNNLQAAEMRGLERIGSANAQGQMVNQLAGLAGQFIPSGG